jgi:hypothetical protein
MKTLKALLLLPLVAMALNLQTLEPNRWHQVPVTWTGGPFQWRPWGTLIQDGRGQVLMYTGVGPTSHGTTCIYANGLWSLDVARDSGVLLKQSNWFCQNGYPTVLPENTADPTPKDRHIYAQMAYSPVDTSLYLAHGASGSDNHPHDFWRFSLPQGRWLNLGAAPGPTAAWDCSSCETNLIEAEGELWYFLNARDIYVYNVAAQIWRYHRIGEDRYAVNPIGPRGTYDTRRRRFAFYGQKADGTASSLMSFFHKDSLTWSTRQGPVALKNAALQYVPRHDLYLLGRGGQDTLRTFSPETGAWATVPAAGSAGSGGWYLEFVYDPIRDLLITMRESGVYVLRYTPPGGGSPPVDTCEVVHDTVTVTDTLFLPQPSRPGRFIVGGEILLEVEVVQ